MAETWQPKLEDRCAEPDTFVVFNGPLLFELSWGVLAGALVWLAVVYRRWPDPDTLPTANLSLLLTTTSVMLALDVGLRWFDRVGKRFTQRLFNQRRCGVLVMVPGWIWALGGVVLSLGLYYLVPPEEIEPMPSTVVDLVGAAPSAITHRPSRRPNAAPTAAPTPAPAAAPSATAAPGAPTATATTPTTPGAPDVPIPPKG